MHGFADLSIMKVECLYPILGLFLLVFSNIAFASDFLIIPGVRVGDIAEKSSETDLKKSYGGAEVIEFEVTLGEGETEMGTVVFPKDGKKRIEILWFEPKTKINPKRIQISGEASVWHTSDGISIGTDLKKLEKINGKSFRLSGFNWDYSGTVSSWNEGALQKPFHEKGRIILRLAPTDKFTGNSEIHKVSGDREFLSSNQVMQKINPSVYQIIVKFQKPKVQLR